MALFPPCTIERLAARGELAPGQRVGMDGYLVIREPIDPEWADQGRYYACRYGGEAYLMPDGTWSAWQAPADPGKECPGFFRTLPELLDSLRSALESA